MTFSLLDFTVRAINDLKKETSFFRQDNGSSDPLE